MTTTDKEVKRVTRGEYRVLYASKDRRIVVSIQQGDVLEFREHGCKTRWVIPIDSAFRYAVRMKALHDAAERRLTGKPKKRGRR